MHLKGDQSQKSCFNTFTQKTKQSDRDLIGDVNQVKRYSYSTCIFFFKGGYFVHTFRYLKRTQREREREKKLPHQKK